jgi:tripartite ATP-independent transporter DctP family solute receptor
MLKKALSLVLVISLVLTLGLSGCGSKDSATNDTQKAAAGKSSTDKSSTDKSSTDKIIIRVGHIVAPGATADKGAQKFKELVEKRTNGAVEVQVFGNSQLGGENDMLNLIQMGSLEMLITGDGIINVFLPQYGALTMPYIFRDMDHMLKVYANPEITDQINNDLIKAKGARLIDAWLRGPRNLTNNKKITSLADLKGVKIRVPEMKVYLETWKRLGALPTPMAFSEVYSAMQQHVVEGQENPYDLIYTSSFYEVQKYLIKTQHVYGPYMVIIGDKFLKGLPEDIQKIILDSAKEAGDYADKETLADQDKLEKALKEKGMEFIEINRDEWVKALEGLPEELGKSLNWKDGFYEQIVNTK